MGRTPRYSPTQLGAIAVGGALFFIVTAVAADVRSWSMHGPPFTAFGCDCGGWIVRLLIVVAIVLPGLIVSQWAVSALRKGIRLEYWSEMEIDALRIQVDRPIWIWLGWMCLAAALAMMIVAPRHHSFVFMLFYFLLPFNTSSSLKMALRKSQPRERKWIDWREFKKLESEHWGERAG